MDHEDNIVVFRNFPKSECATGDLDSEIELTTFFFQSFQCWRRWLTRVQTWKNCTKCIIRSWYQSLWVRTTIYRLLEKSSNVSSSSQRLLRPTFLHRRKLATIFTSVNFCVHLSKSERLKNWAWQWRRKLCQKKRGSQALCTIIKSR